MKRLFALGLTTVLLAGCVSSPTTTPQQTALKSDALGLGGAPAPVIADDWWKALGDPQLDRLVDEALSGSPSLAAAMARVRLAQSQLASTRAGTYPQVTFDSEVVREQLPGHYIYPPPYAGNTEWVGTTAGNLSWSLDLFGKEEAEVDQGRSLAAAAAFDAEAARLMLAGTVTNTYIQLARAYALADAAEETVRQRAEVLGLVSGRVKSGLEDSAAEKQASAQLELAREDLLRARADRDLAVHLLAALIGKGADAYDVARPVPNETALALPQTLPADLLARRADIAAAKARIDAASSGRVAAHQAFYPDIDLLGTAGWAALGFGQFFKTSSLQYGGGAAIHLPIFDAGELRAKYAGATAELDEAVADYNQAVVTAVRQTSDAVTQLRAADGAAADQTRALADAQANYDLATSRYKAGLSSELVLLSAEDVLIQARRSSAVLSADQASTRVALVMALGGGFDANASTSKQADSHD
jgi:NodT family efflux transporter outer membrane factor (OMF) lipoprotein